MISQPYALDPRDIDHFEQQGFVKLDAVLDPAVVARYEPEITRKVLALNPLDLPMEQRTTSQQAFLQVPNLWRHSRLVKELVFSERLARIAAELMGVRGVRLYHDQALYKEGGGGITPWHADQYYWPLSSDRTCTVWIPLQPTPEEMGPVAFAAASHRLELGRDLPIGDESEAALDEVLAAHQLSVVCEPFALGDVSYHQGWTFHRAGSNRTDTPRRAMTVIYMDAEIRVVEPANENQRGDLGWMPGARPGQIPDTPLNPVLYLGSRDD